MKPVIEIAADYFGVPVEELRGLSRARHLAKRRNIAMKVCSQVCGSTIAALQFNRSRTLMHKLTSPTEKEFDDESLRRDYENLQRLVTGLDALPRLDPRPTPGRVAYGVPAGKAVLPSKPQNIYQCECGNLFPESSPSRASGRGCPACREIEARNGQVYLRRAGATVACTSPYTVHLPTRGRNYA